MKSSIIQMSTEYSIVTQFTSFVAIEERDEEEKSSDWSTGGKATSDWSVGGKAKKLLVSWR